MKSVCKISLVFFCLFLTNFAIEASNLPPIHVQGKYLEIVTDNKKLLRAIYLISISSNGGKTFKALAAPGETPTRHSEFYPPLRFLFQNGIYSKEAQNTGCSYEIPKTWGLDAFSGTKGILGPHILVKKVKEMGAEHIYEFQINPNQSSISPDGEVLLKAVFSEEDEVEALSEHGLTVVVAEKLI